MSAPQGPGTFADLNEGDATRKSTAEQALTRGSSAANAASGLQDAATTTGGDPGSLADGSASPQWTSAVISARQEQLSLLQNPGQALLDNGLGFLVSIVLTPLIEIAEFAIGDPEQMRATGKGWDDVAKWLDEVAEQEPKRAQATAETWVGKDGDAFRRQMTKFGGGVEALSEDVRGLKETLDGIADMFDMFVEFVIDLLTELIISLIIQWLAALAASWITAGASVGAASAGTAGQVAVTGGRIAAQVAKIQRQLYQWVKKLEEILNRIRDSGKLGKLLTRGISKSKTEKVVDPDTGETIREFTTSKTGNVFMKGQDLHKTGEEALAANVVGKGLGTVLGGSPSFAGAGLQAGAETAGDQAVKQIPKQMYEKADQTINGELTPEERQAAQDKGFS